MRWTRLAAGLIDTPMALLSLVDGERQFFKAYAGQPVTTADGHVLGSFCVVDTEIPIGGRIVFICDALHAMTSERPYRSARSLAEALAELNAEAGRQFDPDLVAVMTSLLEGANRAPARLSGTGQRSR